MTHKLGVRLALVLIAICGGGVVGFLAFGTSSRAAATARMSYEIDSTGIEYVTSTGTSSTFPGQLNLGDRIFGRDALTSGGKTIGYDNGICTVTYDRNVLCDYVEVFQGKGDLSVSWLWVDRTGSVYGPKHFSGIITGGSGAYQGAHGAFDATVETSGKLAVSGTTA
jgi:hypothetical protein